MKNPSWQQKMNPHVKRRLELAQKLSEKLSEFTGVQAIVAGGSVARGYADIYSDLELLIYWNQEPDADTQLAVFRKLEAERRYPKLDMGYNSAYLISGFPVDVWHKTVKSDEAAIDKVLGHFSTDLDASNVLDTLQFCKPLYGSEYIQPWKEQVENYPDELALRFLEAYLPHFHLRQLYYASRRENPAAFYSILASIQNGLFLVLLALNKSYFPTFKWFYKRLAELPIGPEQIEARMRQMYLEPPVYAAAKLKEVLEETLEIVETCYPQLDTGIARYGVGQPVPKKFDELP